MLLRAIVNRLCDLTNGSIQILFRLLEQERTSLVIGEHPQYDNRYNGNDHVGDKKLLLKT
ncbi:hypothetical protein D3C85_1863010 [compost metagenome]